MDVDRGNGLGRKLQICSDVELGDTLPGENLYAMKSSEKENNEIIKLERGEK